MGGVKICAAGTCNSVKHLYSWPDKAKYPALHRNWTAFVKKTVPEFILVATSRLCSKHFSDSCFSNLGQYKEGYVTILSLDKDKAEPTIQFESTDNSASALTPKKQLTTPDSTPMEPRARRVAIRECERENDPKFKAIEKTIRERSALKILKAKTWKPMSTKPAPMFDPSKQRTIGTNTEKYMVRPHRRSKGCQVQTLSLTTQTEDAADENPGTEISAELCEDEELVRESHNYDRPEEVKYIEWDDEDDEERDEVEDDEGDPDYAPPEDDWEEFSHFNMIKDLPKHLHREEKIIVSLGCLQYLMQSCLECSKPTSAEMSKKEGAYVEFTIRCINCATNRTWSNTPKLGHSYAINNLISGAILFTGASPAKALRVLASLNVARPTYDTYIRHQRQYLHGVINEKNTLDSTAILGAITEPLNLGSDGRCDSPGHCALYGINTMMDDSTKLIIASQLVKSTECTSSNAMELEGFKRCHALLSDHGVPVNSLTTDRHMSIAKYVREEWSDVQHFFDIWHIAKGLKKKLARKSKEEKYKLLCQSSISGNTWIRSILNHMYWSVNSTPDPNLRVSRWCNLIDHIRNIHTACEHGATSKKIWVPKGSALDIYLHKELLSTRLLNDIRKAGKETTSELESFHKTLNHFTPKLTGFSYNGMRSRLSVCIMYHNENVTRKLLKDKQGNVRYKIARSKDTKLAPTAKALREPPTYQYVSDLMDSLEQYLVAGTKPEFDVVQPKTLYSQAPQEDRNTTIQKCLISSRGVKRKLTS